VIDIVQTAAIDLLQLDTIRWLYYILAVRSYVMELLNNRLDGA